MPVRRAVLCACCRAYKYAVAAQFPAQVSAGLRLKSANSATITPTRDTSRNQTSRTTSPRLFRRRVRRHTSKPGPPRDWRESRRHGAHLSHRADAIPQTDPRPAQRALRASSSGLHPPPAAVPPTPPARPPEPEQRASSPEPVPAASPPRGQPPPVQNTRSPRRGPRRNHVAVTHHLAAHARRKHSARERS